MNGVIFEQMKSWMTSVQRILTLVLFSVLLLQCSSQEKHTLCRLITAVETDGANVVSISYVFEGSRLTKETRIEGATTLETTYRYDVNGNVDKSTLTTGGIPISTSYAYNGLNQLVSTLYTYNGDTTNTYYTYNDFGQLVHKSVTTQSGGGPFLTMSAEYEYPDLLTRNPSMITNVAGTNSVVYSYLYDNKFNPERDLVFPSLQHYNNITQIIQGSSVETITYMYNSTGYPISAISSSGKTTAWTYDCQEI